MFSATVECSVVVFSIPPEIVHPKPARWDSLCQAASVLQKSVLIDPVAGGLRGAESQISWAKGQVKNRWLIVSTAPHLLHASEAEILRAARRSPTGHLFVGLGSPGHCL